MARSRSRRLRRIARQTADLRYSPEKRQIEAALGEAQGTRDASIRGARAAGSGLRAAIRAARPEFKKTYGETRRMLNNASSVLQSPAGATGAAAAILAAASGEHQAALDANAGARRDTLSDLTQQGIRAREGQAFAVQAAREGYQADSGKLLAQLLGISEDEGKFAAAEFGRLVENDMDRQVRRAGQRETARHNRAVEGETGRHNKATERNQAAKAHGHKFQSDAAHGAAADKIDEAKHWAKLLRKGNPNISREAVAKALADGRPSAEVYETVTDAQGHTKRQPVLNPDGTVKMTHEIPQLGANVYLQAALDQVFDGHVRRHTVRKLRARGFMVRKLPLTSYEAWRRKHRASLPHPHGGKPSQGAGGYPFGPGAGSVH